MGLFLNIFFLIAVVTMSYIAIKTAKDDVLRWRLKNARILNLASASSANKKRREAVVSIQGEQKFIVKGQPIDETQYQPLLVDGWSMKSFGVENGDIVFINRKEKEFSDKSIIALKIEPENKNRIEYKLRKFIEIQQFNDADDFQKWIAHNHPELIGKYEGNKVEDRIKKAREQQCKLVISKTMIKRFGRKRLPHCSVHLENAIVGKVQYRIPRESVQILSKK